MPPTPIARAIPSLRFRRSCALLGVAIAMLTLWVYLPVRHHEFVAYDDGDYVMDNEVVQKGLTTAGVAWAFTTGHASNWHPLTWISHMLDVQLFGPGPAAPHWVNVALHIVNAALAFAVLVQLTGGVWCSAFVAAVFAVHPAHVESVAWVAERKDVLSAFFFLLTLWTYAVRTRVSTRSAATIWYFAALFFFALGLMSKPMLVTLPCVLLLLDYWPLGRLLGSAPNVAASLSEPKPGASIQQNLDSLTLAAPSAKALAPLLREKLPFFFLSIVSSVITFAVQNRGGTVRSFAAFSFGHRVENALISYVRYLGELFWPVDLAFFYPSAGHLPLSQVASALAAILVLTSAVIWFRRRFPFLPVGWLWFCGMLVPVSGLIQVGDQSIADRYTYLPSLGVFIALAWGAGEIIRRWPQVRGVVVVAGVAVIAVCGVRARAQVGYWQNTELLCEHALVVTGENFVAYNTLASDCFRRGQLDDAIRYYERALTLRPDFAVGHHNLGIALSQKGQLDDAIAHLETVAALQPENANAQNNLGWILRQNGRLDEAIVALQRALKLRPNYAEAHNNLGKALALKADVRGAISHYEAALQLQPDNIHALVNLAWVRATSADPSLRDAAAAIELAERARELSRAADGELLETLAAAYAEAGRFDDAIQASESALGWARAQSNAAVIDRLETQLARYRAGIPWRDDRGGANAANVLSPSVIQSKTSALYHGSPTERTSRRNARLGGGSGFEIVSASAPGVRCWRASSNPTTRC